MKKIWWHWQNLNEDRHTGRKGSPLKHGRAWFYIGNACFTWEWNFWTKFCHAYVDIGGSENDVAVCIAFPPIALWFHIEGVIPYKKLDRWNGRETGFRIHDGALWVVIWNKTMEWSSKDPWWMHFNFNPADFFFGSTKYSERTLQTEQVAIPMPEGTYLATIKLYEATWKRPRWPFPQRIVRAEIEPDKPIPFPGKGENAWDCGEDALHKMTCPANTIYEAVSKTVESVLRDRCRYGGKNWQPEVLKAGNLR